MNLELTIEFLFDLLAEYHIITDKKKISKLLDKKDFFESLYKKKFNEDPFVFDMLMFMLKEESIDIDEESVLKLIAGRAGCDYVVLDPLKVDVQIVITMISLPYGKKNRVLPLYEKDNIIFMAMGNPFRMDIIDQLSTISGKQIIPVVASPKEIEKVLTDIFGFKKSMKAAAKDLSKDTINNMDQFMQISGSTEMDDKHIVNAVDFMLKYAVEQQASDVHIEPKRDETLIRFRLDGVLHTIYNFPVEAHLPFISRLKMLSRMDISEKRRPQDGRFKIRTEHGEEVELRASTIPVVCGEKMVLRILEAGNFIKKLEKIGFIEDELYLWRESIKKGYGMLLVTGPTGSGKSTTLYSTLKELAQPDVNIVSVEDPIEIVIEEINQMGVNKKAEITFASALRHILRQDPDIIMIGEIRDKETAEHAIQSALTGHLVFSTLHTNDTASTVERLIDLGIEPFLAASVLNGILAQRLVRKLCPFCTYEREMNENEKIMLSLPVEKEFVINDSEGCVKCRYTGYKGREAIIEYMPVNQKLTTMISKRASTDEIRNNAVMDGMVTLKEAAIKKLADGITSFDEIVKALYFE